jgi:hypothetical protein
MNFEEQTQRWVALDTQIKQLNEKTKELRTQRAQIEQQLTNYASLNNMLTSTIKISDGHLKFTHSRVQEPLTFKYLDKKLNEVIKNESQAKLILNHFKETREIKLVPEIKRFSNN